MVPLSFGGHLTAYLVATSVMGECAVIAPTAVAGSFLLLQIVNLHGDCCCQMSHLALLTSEL